MCLRVRLASSPADDGPGPFFAILCLRPAKTETQLHSAAMQHLWLQSQQSVASLTLAEKLRQRARGGEGCGGLGRSAGSSVFPLTTGMNYSPGSVTK